jgi:hypothetical protein
MSDIHRLPLLEHDLPEYVNNGPTKQEKVKVFQDSYGRWNWFHKCRFGSHRKDFWGFTSQREAFVMAMAHAKECCR